VTGIWKTPPWCILIWVILRKSKSRCVMVQWLGTYVRLVRYNCSSQGNWWNKRSRTCMCATKITLYGMRIAKVRRSFVSKLQPSLFNCLSRTRSDKCFNLTKTWCDFPSGLHPYVLRVTHRIPCSPAFSSSTDTSEGSSYPFSSKKIYFSVIDLLADYDELDQFWKQVSQLLNWHVFKA